MAPQLLVYFFPCLQILICLCASGVYGYMGDYRKMIYWLAAAVITASVTF
jgi:hypothetical protein